ncbi:MAG: sigma-54-dependent Fis family transcriptional regulator [Planctomycetes bacterium]|nr:sigma-54-dependent Fis family transcriptional regulator [Planctomycetota bacterium]
MPAEDLVPEIVGISPKIKALKQQVRQVAAADYPVLILGESGAGKEVVARAIHRHSARAASPFVGQSCLAIPETLIESELFGHEPGAFTDARERRIGLFEQAQGGSLFLDEIGDIPLGFQKRLLRVLQEREVRRLGGTEATAINVRIMAATNAPIEQLVAQGAFRSDLLYRLNTFEVRVPALRQRVEDIPLLIDHFLKKHGVAYKMTNVAPPPPPMMEKLRAYPWPGNVRELENFVVRWMTLGEEALDVLDRKATYHLEPQDANRRWLSMTLEEIEAEVIKMVLEDCSHNKTLAAKRLGLARKSLYNKLERYGIKEVEKRN